MAESIRVRATRLGYIHNKRVKEGEEFTLVPVKGFKKAGGNGDKTPIEISAEQQFSERWMERVEDDEKPKKVEVQNPKNRSKDVI